MELSENQKNNLKQIPGVDKLILEIKKKYPLEGIPEPLYTKAARKIIDEIRKDIISGVFPSNQPMEASEIELKTYNEIVKEHAPNFKRVVNGTGVVVHTNLGRSLLSKEVAQFVYDRSTRYSNLELDLSTGKRGLRYSLVEDLICEITGCEAAMAVNNNAAAVLLCLDTFAKDKEVIVSRGELVEIGGSFRIPEVMEKTGAILKETGTTNRTHLKDYANAYNPEKTAMFLKVHTSNFDIIGFTSSVSLMELHTLAKEKDVILMEDLGSGTFTDLSKIGLPKEPTVQDSVKAGTDLVTFSGDKLLGGPQAGIIAGRKKLIEQIRKNPLTRALRIDKMTLAALEKTLRLYREPEKALKQIPTLRMLSAGTKELTQQAFSLKQKLDELNIKDITVSVFESSSRAGGGSLPETNIPTMCLAIEIKDYSSSHIENFMRNNNPSIMGRIEVNKFILDLRTIQDDEEEIITSAFKKLKDELK